MKRRTILTLVTVHLISCKHETPAGSQTKIVGGDIVGENSIAYTSTVALVSSEKRAAFCTGTLIAPNLVLTAAHCIDGFKPADIKVLFGSSDRDPKAIRTDVDQFASYKPQLSKFFPNFDIAWIKLKSAAPTAYKPIEILNDRNHEALTFGNKTSNSATYKLAGFGKQSTDCRDPSCKGIKMEVSTYLSGPVISNARLFSLLKFGPKPGFGACNGDSGGPAYLQTKAGWYLIGATNGLTSYLTPSAFQGNGTGGCEAGEFLYTFVGDYVRWIEESSQVNLSYDKASNPRRPSDVLQSMNSVSDTWTFADWFAYNNHHDPAWYTVSKLSEIAVSTLPSAYDRTEGFLKPERIVQVLESMDKIIITGVDIDLQVLQIRDRSISDLRPLASVTIKKLELQYNRIRDYSPLTRVQGLEHLKIGSNKSTDLVNIPVDLNFTAQIPELKDLILEDIVVKSLEQPLPPLTSLQELTITHVGNLNLAQIPLPNLKKLTIRSSEISNIVAIGNYSKLEYLVLDHISNALISQLAHVRLPSSVEIMIDQKDSLSLPPELNRPGIEVKVVE